MKFGEAEIVTPLDNPCQFDPDWRNRIACMLASAPRSKFPPEYSGYAKDRWIKEQAAYLREEGSGGDIPEKHRIYRYARIWSMGSGPADTKFRLEPLLLTPVSYEVIALDLGGGSVPPSAFEAYEKLYFNIRDDSGRLSRSCQLRQWFAMPDGELDRDSPPELVWKAVGALAGYDTLVRAWMWRDAHGLSQQSEEYMMDEMWRAAQSRLFMSVFRDNVGHESLAKLLSAFTSQSKLIRESGNQAGDSADSTKALMAVLCAAAPKMVSAARDVDYINAETKAIEGKLIANSVIDATPIKDAGAAVGNEVVEKMITEKVRDR